MSFKIINQNNKARLGKFNGKYKTVETPFFMPVATKSSVKYLSTYDLRKMKCNTMISNSYVLYLRPGHKFIEMQKDIHNFCNYKNVIFTDSGGFQMLNPNFLISLSDKAVKFKDPHSGVKHIMTPEKVMQVQSSIGSDVAMVLDHLAPYGEEKKEHANAVKRTLSWAKRCLNKSNELNENKKFKQNVFGICQGGTFLDLRKKCQEKLNQMDFDGYAQGGLAIGEPLSKMHNLLEKIVPLMPNNKPRYLMGVGSPVDIIESIAWGVDCFDSRYATQNARHGNLFTWQGMLKIIKSEFKDDLKPIDKACDCYVCKNYSRNYIRFLLKQNHPTGKYLASYHNVYWINNFMKEIRKALKKDYFDDFRRDFLKGFKV